MFKWKKKRRSSKIKQKNLAAQFILTKGYWKQGDRAAIPQYFSPGSEFAISNYDINQGKVNK